MILSVYITGSGEREQWQAELLEYSWQESGQSGELIRLVAGRPGAVPPLHTLARVEPVLSWAEHPYIKDTYSGYDLPAALMQWLLREPLDATILLLDSESIMVRAIEQEVVPGQPIAHRWENFPLGEGPFKLPSAYTPLQAYCVNRELVLPKVQLPVLIHSSDLLKLAARWLELVGIIRKSVIADSEPAGNAVKIAFAIAAAEYRLAPNATDLSGFIVEAGDGSRTFLDYCDKFDADRTSGSLLHALRPSRLPGVRQARVLDQWYLELGSPSGLVTLNPSAGAIWNLCDGRRTLLDIARELQASYNVPMETIAADVTQAAKVLRFKGALDLETVN